MGMEHLLGVVEGQRDQEAYSWIISMMRFLFSDNIGFGLGNGKFARYPLLKMCMHRKQIYLNKIYIGIIGENGHQ